MNEQFKSQKSTTNLKNIVKKDNEKIINDLDVQNIKFYTSNYFKSQWRSKEDAGTIIA